MQLIFGYSFAFPATADGGFAETESVFCLSTGWDDKFIKKTNVQITVLQKH